MAKAQFHKNQRVFVKPVGTWAIIEHVQPQWAKGLDEPIRVYYDVGLGREFGADELQSEQALHPTAEFATENWRIVRARNKWQTSEDSQHHPYPGTYPVLVTGETDWGGWRVPGAEYDLHPQKIEAQARMMVTAPKLVTLASSLIEFARRESENIPAELAEMVDEAKNILRYIAQEQSS